jgi:hypothetical protein
MDSSPRHPASLPMNLRCQIANRRRKDCRLAILAALSVGLLAGCASLKDPPNADIFSYSYLSLNFSGKGWDKARSYCASRGKLAHHAGTNCGFFICTTEVSCITE